MVQAWYMDSTDDDQRKEHHLDPPQFISLTKLNKKSGVLHWEIDVENIEKEGKLQKIKDQRGYNYQDQLECSKEKLCNYEEKLKMFFTEHLHADEEIRLFIEGSGYFDVRDVDDKWIRIKASKGDLLVLPAGIYHRFTLDMNNYAKVIRLFRGDPVWAAINRPADDHPVRKQYVDSLGTEIKCQ